MCPGIWVFGIQNTTIHDEKKTVLFIFRMPSEGILMSFRNIDFFSSSSSSSSVIVLVRALLDKENPCLGVCSLHMN
jgi:hypothetical protein